MVSFNTTTTTTTTTTTCIALDATYYKQLWSKRLGEFHTSFFDPVTQVYGDGTQVRARKPNRKKEGDAGGEGTEEEEEKRNEEEEEEEEEEEGDDDNDEEEEELEDVTCVHV